MPHRMRAFPRGQVKIRWHYWGGLSSRGSSAGRWFRRSPAATRVALRGKLLTGPFKPILLGAADATGDKSRGPPLLKLSLKVKRNNATATPSFLRPGTRRFIFAIGKRENDRPALEIFPIVPLMFGRRPVQIRYSKSTWRVGWGPSGVWGSWIPACRQ
jgi:hypothetical protein